jgi:diamine N-acetyltransferase
MTVSLRPITVDNWVECIELKPTEEQVRAGFVSPNALSLAQAHYDTWWEPLGIYADERMVGFMLHGRWPATGVPSYYSEAPVGVDCILRFMVDGRYQRQGYGRAGLAQLIERIRQRPNARAIHLSYEPDNSAAAALYACLGFRPTGRFIDGEMEMWLDLGIA